MILAFYSYKGGVGRTSLALDTAARLATGGLERPALRVLVWDLDLDAPGIRHFPALQSAIDQATLGTHDLLALLSASDDGADVVSIEERHVLEMLREAIVTSSDIAEGRLSLLLPTGARTESAPMDTGALFSAGAPGPELLVLVADLARRRLGFDIVIVDARTGINELSAAATTVLADCAVLVFRLDGQDVAHLDEIANAIHEAWSRGGVSASDLPNRLYRVANLVPSPDGDLELAAAIARRREELAEQRLTPHLELPLRPLALVRESIPRIDGPELDVEAELAIEQLADWVYLRWADLVRRDSDGSAPEVVREQRDASLAAAEALEKQVAQLLDMAGWTPAAGTTDVPFDLVMEKVGDFGRRQLLVVECKVSQRGASVSDVEHFVTRASGLARSSGVRLDAMLVAYGYSHRAKELADQHEVLLTTPASLLDEQAPPDPLRRRARELWEGTALERHYVEPTGIALDRGGHATGDRLPLDEHVQSWLSRSKNGMLCVLGDFGAGKTTFCRRLAAQLAQNDAAGAIPLYVDLRVAGSTAVTLDGLLRHALDEAQVDAPRLAPWRSRLANGSIVLLVDGFDELLGYTDPSRMEDLLDELQRAAETSRVVLDVSIGLLPQ